MAANNDGIFSLEQRLALRRLSRQEHRQRQAQTVRVLARIEAAEQLRRAQEEARRPIGPTRAVSQPRRGLLARIASWISGTTPMPTAVALEHRYYARESSRQLAAAEAPDLLKLREEIAKELEHDYATAAELPAGRPTAKLDDAAPDADSPDVPPTRWG